MSASTVPRRNVAIAATAVALLASACSGTDGDASADAGDRQELRTIEHALGTTEIEGAPERVVTLADYADLDSVLALGIEPVAFGFTDAWGTGLAPWQVSAGADGIEQLDASGEVDIEAVAAAEPDLIVGMAPMVDPAYEQLSEVAPTVAVAFDSTWQEQLEVIAQATGRTAQADELKADVAAELSDGAAQLSEHADRPIMVASYYGDSLYIQGEQSSVTGLLRELGLTVVTTTDEQLDNRSLESVPVLDQAEVILSLATDRAATRTAQESPLWQALSAVEAGRYTALTGGEARGVSDGFNALSYQTVIDQLVDVIRETAAGNGTPLS